MTTTQAILHELVTHCAVNGVEIIKVTCEEDYTKVQSHDEDKTLFIEGKFGTVPEFVGEFGMTNLKMLSGLIGFANYKSDTASFKANRRKIGDDEVLDQFEFKGKGSKSIFKLMDVNHIPNQAIIANVPWNIVIDGITKDKLAEFQQFAGLYSEVDKQFTASTEDGNLIFNFGKEASSTHSGSMTFGEVTGSLSQKLLFPVDKFIMLMKLAVGKEGAKLMFTDKGVLGVEIESDYGLYKYYLRQSVQ